MFNKILIAFNFTEASIQALRTAAALAREQNARLHIFSALDYSGGLEKSSPESIRLMASAQERFKSEIRPTLDDALRVTFVCYPADPVVAICKEARNIQADLIVLGTHLRPGPINLTRIDYVGITVIEKSPCPVLLVPFGAEAGKNRHDGGRRRRPPWI